MKRFQNQHQHPSHNFLSILRWKLGLLEHENYLSNCDQLPATKSYLADDLPTLTEPEVRVFWIGHSSFLVQCGAVNILIDPVYSEYCSPVPFPGLRRLQPAGIPWQKLPGIDVVLITHSHYDHLDASVVKKLASSAHFLVPTGLASWMRKKKVKTLSELRWGESIILRDCQLQITCCPSQHSSARKPWDKDQSHWCGWLIEYLGKKIYHCGDTGYCPHFKKLGETHGPIDLSLIPIGGYSPRQIMQTVHCNISEAVQIHLDLRAKQSIGCHWGTFKLTAEPVSEPPTLLKRELRSMDLPEDSFMTLPIGGFVTL